MKTKITLLALLFTLLGFAQNGINYKAVIKDNLGNIVANQTVKIRFTIIKGTTNVYQETQLPTTDANGIAIVNIGEGSIISGTFAGINWASNNHFLNVEVDIGGDNSFTNMGTTEFKSVPYALNVTGLEAIDEGNGIGWRLKGRDPDNYDNIGNNAVDLSYIPTVSIAAGARGPGSFASGNSTSALGMGSTAMGNFSKATGENSTSFGKESEASGNISTAMGYKTKAIGYYSTSLGKGTEAIGDYSMACGINSKSKGMYSVAMGLMSISGSAYSTAIGRYNVGSGTYFTWIDTESLFEVGNGTSDSSRKNALTVLKNGNVGIGNHTPASLLEVSHKNISPTATNLSNAFSIRNSGVTNQSWQFHVNSLGALVLYHNGIYSGFFQTTGEYFVTSDGRLKKDIMPLETNTLQKVMQLNPVSYKMINQTDSDLKFGLISQEVQQIYPNITEMVGGQDILALSYSELIPVLIKAIQEQQEIIDNQDSKINTLTAELDQLKTIDNRVKYLESLLKTANQ